MADEMFDSTPTAVLSAETIAPGTAPVPTEKVAVSLRRGRPAARSKNSWRTKRMAWLLVGAGLATAVAVGLRPHPVPVETAVVSSGTLVVTVDEDGRTRVKDRYLISAPLAGTVPRMALEAGDSVARGALVARIVPTAAPLLDPRSRAESQARIAAARAAVRQAGSAVERARAASDLASREATRQRNLLRDGAAASQVVEQAETTERMRREELVSAEFGLEVAASELRLAQAAFQRVGAAVREEFPVRAPVSGRILRVLHESEGVVQPGTPLLEIGNPMVLEVVVDVLTTDAVGIRPGAPVRIDRWGGDSTLSGHVHRIEPSAFTRLSALGVEEQRVNVVIDLDPPYQRWGRLGDGYRVEASIVVWEGRDRLIIPGGAVFRHDDGWATYVVEDGRARLRPIRVGHRNPAAIEVLGGVHAGEQVVLYPSDNVVDGARTEIQ